MLANLRRRFLNISDGFVMGVLLGLFVGAVGVSLFSHFRTASPELWAWADGFAQNFGTEMFGAFLTFILIETLVGRRKERQRIVREMRSGDTVTALYAIHEARERGWLTDRSLNNVMLRGTQLTGADLRDARLEGVNLRFARLEGAQLARTHLEGGDLRTAQMDGANLRGAVLHGANLSSTGLAGADLQGADLTGVDLSRAHLEGANLQQADLSGARLGIGWLDGANLAGATLSGADLSHASLRGACGLTVAMLRDAAYLGGAVLPDGFQLPGDESWQLAFDEWCAVALTDDRGVVIPVPLAGGD